jgi:hypothetical protein
MRKRDVVMAAVLTLTALGPDVGAQARAPGTDVWIVPMKQAGIAVSFGEPRNASDRPGYDNQPSFTLKGDAVLFTATDEKGKTDIWRFALPDGKPTRVTNLPMSLYSATSTPDGKSFSFIRVEPDSTQRLWRLPLDGQGAPSLVLENVKPVGYHVWGGDHTVIVYVLGRPSTLQIADDRTGKAEVVATNVGRALGKVPGRDAITFQQLVKDSLPWITDLDLKTKQVRPMVQAPPGADYHVWAPNGALLTATGSRIFRYTDDGWAPVADFAKFGVKNISRIAVSPRGNWFAFVAEDKPSP